MFIRFRARRWQEEELAKRLCQLMYGNTDVRLDKTGGDRRWHIGATANNCWLHPKGDEVFVLVYRYGMPERMDALAKVMEWLLDVEILPDPVV